MNTGIMITGIMITGASLLWIANQFYDTELHGELKPVKDSLYRDSRGRFTKKPVCKL